MVWDLRGALLKKEEKESARLMDFAFRLRARTMRRLAEALGRDPAELVRRTALADDATILAALAEEQGIALPDLRARWQACEDAARADLVREIGDPAPHRLA